MASGVANSEPFDGLLGFSQNAVRITNLFDSEGTVRRNRLDFLMRRILEICESWFVHSGRENYG
jgi:hypothetical protein